MSLFWNDLSMDNFFLYWKKKSKLSSNIWIKLKNSNLFMCFSLECIYRTDSKINYFFSLEIEIPFSFWSPASPSELGRFPGLLCRSQWGVWVLKCLRHHKNWASSDRLEFIMPGPAPQLHNSQLCRLEDAAVSKLPRQGLLRMCSHPHQQMLEQIIYN